MQIFNVNAHIIRSNNHGAFPKKSTSKPIEHIVISQVGNTCIVST